MFRIKLLIATIVLPLLGADRRIDPKQLRFHYTSSEFPNVVYNVGCLAGQIPCTKPAFEQFWHTRLGWTRDDQSELDAWIDAMNRSSGDGEAPRAPFLANYNSYYPGLAARERLIGIAAEAQTPGQFVRRIQALTASQDAEHLGKALAHFERRFHPWWSSTGASAVQDYMRQFERLMRSDRMTILAGQVGGFVEAEPKTRDVYLNAIASPDPKSNNGTATAISNHFFAEVRAGDTPADMEWKAMHELTHYFYSTAPREKHIGLMREFLQTGRYDAPPLYTLLNEALATAVQLLVYERKGIPATDFYRHPYIPRLALSTIPLLKQSLAGGGSLFHGFSGGYIRTGEAELGDELTSPKFLLSAVALLANEENQKAIGAFVEEFHPNFSCSTQRAWQSFSDVSAILFLTYDELPAFAEDFLTNAAATSQRGFAYITKHGTEAHVYYLVGRDTSATIDVVKRLASVKSVNSEGLLFQIN